MPDLTSLRPQYPAGYLPIDEAARHEGVSVMTLRRRIWRGDLFAARLGGASNGRLLVPLASLRQGGGS
jgi:hypothetical protein